ncbi:glycosyl transferase [Umezawaea sp. NPDC059074]|uniref:glycosyl transferase n=1 Tax=Umezawaea sp. NPDC059074 TaxID=3346716 RepID=UPI0036C84800
MTPTAGEGILSRTATVVYWFLVVEALVLLTTAPALAAVVFLAGGRGNAPLIGLCFVPVAPALSAAVFAWRVFLTERDLSPAEHFRRGYRLNWRDVLHWWVPTLAVLTLIGFTLANLDLAGVPAGYGVVLLLVGAAVLLWAALALVLSSTLSLRTRDLVRLAAFYLGARPAVTFGVLSLLVAAAGIVVLTSDWVLVLLASPAALLLLRTTEPVLRDAAERFTA